MKDEGFRARSPDTKILHILESRMMGKNLQWRKFYTNKDSWQYMQINFTVQVVVLVETDLL